MTTKMTKYIAKTCGQTHNEMLIEYAKQHGKTLFKQIHFESLDDTILSFETKTQQINRLSKCLDDSCLDENEISLSKYCNIDKIIETIKSKNIVGCCLGMGGEYSDFFHCFIIQQKDISIDEQCEANNFYLTHTYWGEIHERTTSLIDLNKFGKLLESGDQELWTDIFSVEEEESGCQDWKLTITTFE